MSKQEFLAQLRKKLGGLPQDDREERLAFYSEMIDDRMKEGLSEEEAVAGIGSVEQIVAQVIQETPIGKLARERIRPKRRMGAGEIILLVLGSPIWLSLGVAAVAVIISILVSLWATVVSAWAAFGSLVGGAFGGLVAFVVFLCGGHSAAGVAMLSGAFICAGLSVLMFYGCKLLTKGMVWLTKKVPFWIKNCFIKKEVAE